MVQKIIWETIADLKDAPTTCGVYQYWDGDRILYIGKAVNLRARLTSHAQNAKLDLKERQIVAGDRINYTLCDTEFKALLLESRLIREHRPPHNRVWKDDKSYLYIVIDMRAKYAKPIATRAHDLKPIFAKGMPRDFYVYGPFPSSRTADEVLRAIRRLIPFCRSRSVGKRGCFYSRIGLCDPCPGEFSHLSGRDHTRALRRYRAQLRSVIKILEGDTEPVIKHMTSEMEQASAEEDYEKALTFRNKLRRFERFIVEHSFSEKNLQYNESEDKLRSLEQTLAPYFGIIKLTRIECYDASNSALKHAVVSLVVMTDGLLDNGQYRRFKIKDSRARSDFGRLSEALTRRLRRVGGKSSWARPDLIVIDGGIPQLRILQKAFDQIESEIPFIGIAKSPDRLVIPRSKGHKVDYITLRLPSDDPGLRLLSQLRDESHRFANNYRKVLVTRELLGN